jgi:dolichyl-phosphate beta-glucosyltransferase
MSERVVIIIPCYNEAERFSAHEFEYFFDDEQIYLLLVDDGSSDGTRGVIERFAAGHERADTLALAENRGKAEAVRAGMRYALSTGADVVGYADADLATPVSELLRMVELIVRTDVSVVVGSRIARMGANIDRAPMRHYLGRAFATAASLILRQQFYDTQCGAKLFRATEALESALSERFRSRWAFDVELLGRLALEGADFLEMPLDRWQDVPGSKMSIRSMARAGLDLIQIGYALERRRRLNRAGDP